MNAQQTRLYRDVQFLTEIRPYRNYLNPESLAKVRNYIRAEFQKLGLAVEEQQWEADGHTYANIIGSYNPQQTKRLVVGAHYDVAGEQPGADDNASAVAGLLESARLIAEHQPQLDYRIDFVAYCLEEPPFFATPEMGSYIHAKSLAEAGVDVMGMICYEMIGYFSDEPGSQPVPEPELEGLYPDAANFIIVVGTTQYKDFNEKVHALMAKDAKIDVQVVSFPATNLLASLSDQRSYWAFGYPALMINDTSFVRNPHYHTKGDTIETLDFPKMTAVVNAAYQAIVGM